MFGSTNPFGQSSSSPFGSQSVFGQSSNAGNNPFAPKPFGGSAPFGAQTGSSIFGGTSTGVFGATQSSSPFSSTTTFGASSSPAFGSSTPAFGSSSSSFGGSSVFGQKPVFGAFGSTSTQTSPFGSTAQPSQPAFGGSIFGSSTPFGASSQSAFGATSTAAFGATSTPAFGGTSTPAFGATGNSAFGATGTPSFGATSTPAFGASSTPAFGATSTPAFGSTTSPTFGSTGTAFGVSSAPLFGSGGAFGASSNPAFGSSSSAFGASSAPGFGASSAPAFGASSNPSFSFASTPAFGQSSSTFSSSSPFGTSTSPFGAQSSMFGAQSTTPTFASTGFGQSAFVGQRGGSRVTSYAPTPEPDNSSSGAGGAVGKLESISAMPVYKDKSHEELRWEDYQLGDKGGPLPAGQSSGINFGSSTTQSNLSGPSPTFGQSSSSLFSTPTSNLFGPKTPGFATSSPAFTSSPFGVSSPSNLFTSTSLSTPSVFGTTSAPFASTSTPSFVSSSSPGFGQSVFTSQVQGSTPAFNSTAMFNSSTPSIGPAGTGFGQTTSAFGPSTTSSFVTPNIFNNPSTGFGNMFSSTPSLSTSTNNLGFGQTAASFSTPFPAQPPQTTGTFSFSNFGQSQSANASAAPTGIFGQNNFGQMSATQSSAVAQPAPVTNPFGTLPAMPQMSIGRGGTAPSVQYGISSMPVLDKPAPVRISSLLTSRHLSQRRIRLPARKYHPKNDGPKVPFFSDDEETASTPKADALFLPRDNPRALVICPTEPWPSKSTFEKASPINDTSTPIKENGNSFEACPPSGGSNSEDKNRNSHEDGHFEERPHVVEVNQKPNGVHDDHSTQKGDSYMTLSGHRAGEAAIVYEHGADIEALMPKLRRSDYYTEPRIQELAAKERAEPGFCRHVKDFVVGRHGYGSIKFLGETDVRRLDLESLVQFNNREVIVYMDDSKKPPVGQGLNKPAEVTLLNIKCFDKKTGHQHTEGPKIEKYKEMLKRKAEDQGAEFVSYDPIKGEWTFRVNHFSEYKLIDEDEGESQERLDMHAAQSFYQEIGSK
ncbi:nuclear pore complex protein NUP98A isoform X1 [Ziziphus jujuba]|uniref:Nuclear pore complex protein NUP98A isoform X1 n=1 Tax=Ziziphus jujuba TaxID=326968 RepID=A0A6P3YSF0_ZIZJJ|nr:nuclear pore complex protein NUP98A isoform X1 [Ziziphus jujuba]